MIKKASYPPASKLRKSAILTVCAALLISGCAAQTGNFPTIAKRPIENLPINDQPDPNRLAQRAKIKAMPLNNAQKTVIANQRVQAQQGNKAFADNLARTRATIAGAGAYGSESWSQGQSALSALTVFRNRTASALTKIDAMLVSAQETVLDDGNIIDTSLIIAAQQDIANMVNNQDAQLARLRQSLKR